MSRIIGICGFIGSGKDTVADYLVNFHGFKRESFANSLKDAVSMVFGWDRELLEGRTKQSREWREQKDEWWSKRLGRDITPRWVLQYWGTEVVRKGFHNDTWVASLENRLHQTQNDIVITDCRFPNEIRAIKAAGGNVIRIKRGPEPDWYQAALNYNAGKRKIGWALGKEELHSKGIHPSEYSWVGSDFDTVLINDGTLNDLFEQVENFLNPKSQELDHLDANQDPLLLLQTGS
jgi:hypothetical protein